MKWIAEKHKQANKLKEWNVRMVVNMYVAMKGQLYSLYTHTHKYTHIHTHESSLGLKGSSEAQKRWGWPQLRVRSFTVQAPPQQKKPISLGSAKCSSLNDDGTHNKPSLLNLVVWNCSMSQQSIYLVLLHPFSQFNPQFKSVDWTWNASCKIVKT